MSKTGVMLELDVTGEYYFSPNRKSACGGISRALSIIAWGSCGWGIIIIGMVRWHSFDKRLDQTEWMVIRDQDTPSMIHRLKIQLPAHWFYKRFYVYRRIFSPTNNCPDIRQVTERGIRVLMPPETLLSHHLLHPKEVPYIEDMVVCALDGLVTGKDTGCLIRPIMLDDLNGPQCRSY